MKRLLILAVFVGAVWYGWTRVPSILERRPSHEAIVENRSGTGLRSIRLTVDGRTFVRQELADRARVAFPFRVGRDASFELTWQWTGREGEARWSGGMVATGPMVQRHTMTIDADAGVLYHVEKK